MLNTLSLFQHFSEYAIVLTTVVVVAFGLRYAKEVIAFILDKLYQFFIQNNSINI